MEIPSKQPEVTTMEFVCRDTGIGMADEFQKHIFEPFVQEHTGSAVDAIARQPEASGKIQSSLLLGCALAEATAIYGFVIALLIILFLK